MHMDAGLQFHLPSHPSLAIPEMVELGKVAANGGVSQLWVTDNLGSRSPFVALAGLAGAVPVRLGTAIMVQYFRNPVDAAGALAAVTELMQGEELIVGIGRGNVRTSRLLDTPAPLSHMRETAMCLRRLLDGEEVAAAELPTLASYFRLADGAAFRLKFPPARPVHVFCGGDGPRSLALGGELMDGLLCGTTFLAITQMGYLDDRLRAFDAAAAGRSTPRRCVAEIKISLSRDGTASRAFARAGVGSRVLGLRWRGFGDDDLQRLGIDPADVDRLEAAKATGGGTSAELVDLVTDPMIDTFYVAGDLGHCRDRIAEIRATAEARGIEQLVFSGISPDFADGLRLLCEHIVPEL